MPGELKWVGPFALDASGPTSPYAHWWLEAVRPDRLRERDCLCYVFRDLGIGVDDREGGWRAEVMPCEHHAKSFAGGPKAADHECCLIPFILPKDVVTDHSSAPRPWIRRPQGADPATDPGASLWLDPPERPGVIVGVIDDGIAFAHERFRRPRATVGDGPGTRVEYVWMQGVRQHEDRRDLIFGRELNRFEIEALMRKHSVGGTVDEPALYRDAGLTEFLSGEVQSGAYRISHGTAVLDRAAGYRPADEAGGAVTIMAVSLPSRITHDTSGTFLDLFVVLAIERILDRARALTKSTGHPYPIVINLSYALTAGPRDGSGMVDRYIEAVRANWTGPQKPPEFFVPAGNHRQARIHARTHGDQRDRALRWRILPDDNTASFVEVWIDREKAQAPVPCRLDPPGAGAAPAPPVIPDDHYADLELDGLTIARAYHSWHPGHRPQQKARQRIVLAVHPSVVNAPGDPTSPSGDWSLTLPPGTPAEFIAQRDDTPFGYRRRGRQSYFLDGSYEDRHPNGRPMAEDPVGTRNLVARAGTMNGFVCGREVNVIAAKAAFGSWPDGAGTARGSEEALYSGKEPVPDHPLPDDEQSSDDSLVHSGVRAAGTFSGSTVILSGSSLAAPAAAREYAERVAGIAPASRGKPGGSQNQRARLIG